MSSKNLSSWIDISEDSDFSIHNLPYCVYKTKQNPNYRVGIGIGESILDMAIIARLGFFDDIPGIREVFQQPVLNDFIRLGKNSHKVFRKKLTELLTHDESGLKSYHFQVLDLQQEAIYKLPLDIGDYTDFYSSKEHATNVGKLFRDAENALLPNWKHLPIAYHGRASSIGISGDPVIRPKGQIFNKEKGAPEMVNTSKLDFELEMAFVVGKDSKLGQPLDLSECGDYIFGFTLFNDWSARDIQRWEYEPLGPFLGKSFASTISPWIVPIESLEDFKVPGPQQDPEVLSYLKFSGHQNYDIHLEVYLESEEFSPQLICTSNTKYLYWNILQQLAHHTSNGCNVRIGDLMASGTISGPEASNYGSMLELSQGGRKPIKIKDHIFRTFLEDGDIITLKAYAEKDGRRIGFGTVRNQIVSNEKV